MTNKEAAMEYRVFKDDVLKSKPHSTRIAARVEAMEMGVVMTASADFIGDASGQFLLEGWEIKAVSP